MTKTDYMGEVSVETMLFLRKIQEIMRDKGYKYDRHIQSASCEWVWQKDGITLTLTGWHGSQPHKWGAGAMIFSLYRNAIQLPIFILPGREFGPGCGIPGCNESAVLMSEEEWQSYQVNLSKALRYLEEHA